MHNVCLLYTSEAAAGQRINISLLDFTAADDRPRAAGHQRTADLTCRQYGYVLDKSNKRNVSVCGGSGRQSHVYISHSNNVRIVLIQPALENQLSGRNFLIKVEGLKCFCLYDIYLSHCYSIACDRSKSISTNIMH